MSEIRTFEASFALSGTKQILSFSASASLSQAGQVVSFGASSRLNHVKSFSASALITDTRGTFRGSMTAADRDALPALQPQDTVITLDASTASSGIDVPRIQFWTGSAFLSGAAMTSPVSGVTNLFTVPTTAGWRVEFGDPTYPLKFWDGTDTNFSVDNTGLIFARSMNIRPKSSDQYGYNITRSSITGDAVSMQVVGDTEYRYFQEVSGEMFWGDGLSTQDVALFRVAKTGGGGYLRVSTGLLWGSPAATSRLEDDYSIRLGQTAKPAAVSNAISLYAKDVSGTAKLFWEDEGGTEYDLSSVGGGTSMATDVLWDALGDLAYGSGADTGAKLSGNTTSTKKYLAQTGNGSISAAPAWSTIDVSSADVTGILAAARFPALTGDVTTSSGALATTIANDAVTYAKFQNIATDSLLGRDTAGTGDPENILLNTTLSMDGSGNLQRAALTGDVTASAGSNATTLAAGSASNLNSGTLPAGRLPALTGDVTTSVGSAATTLAAGNAGNLNAGTLLAARMPALTGDVTTSAGAVATTIANDAVNYAKMQNVSATSRFLGRITAGAGDPEELTAANAKTILALSTSDISGLTTLATDTLWAAVGDLVYGTADNTAAVLTGNTTTTKKFLTQTGNGSVSAAPTWFDLYGANPNVFTGAIVTSSTFTAKSSAAGSLGASFDAGTLAPGSGTVAHYLIGYGANTDWPLNLAMLYDANYVDQYLTFGGYLSGGTRSVPTYTVGNSVGGMAVRWDSQNKVLGFSGLASGIGVSPSSVFTMGSSGVIGIPAGPIELTERTAPSAPASGFGRVYANSTDSLLHYIDDSGNDLNLVQYAPVQVYDEGSFTIPTQGYLSQRDRLTLTSAERATFAGTGRAELNSYAPPFKGSYLVSSFTLNSDEYVLQYKRLSLAGSVRVTAQGTSQVVVTGLDPVSRLVLTGTGGGS